MDRICGGPVKESPHPTAPEGARFPRPDPGYIPGMPCAVRILSGRSRRNSA